MSHVVHDASKDGGELLLAGARHDGLLVRAVLRPQRGQQRHEHRQDVGPHLQQQSVTTIALYKSSTVSAYRAK